MHLYEQWMSEAFQKDGTSNERVWNMYLPKEQKIYEYFLEEKTNTLGGSITEIGERFHMPPHFVVGFLDGINGALDHPLETDTLTEDTVVSLSFAFENLYKKMVEYKAQHLYELPQWENIFTAEKRKELYQEQKTARTVVKPKKAGRNEPCPCGSGKKYKKCCGA